MGPGLRTTHARTGAQLLITDAKPHTITTKPIVMYVTVRATGACVKSRGPLALR
jgi:hypothetical protein